MAQRACHMHLRLAAGEKPLIYTSHMEAMPATQHAQQIVTLIVFTTNSACRTVPTQHLNSSATRPE